MPHDHNKSSPRKLSVGQRVFERFILRRPLGQGGMSVVWLAHDRVLEQEVALKFLADNLLRDRAAVERLKHETRRNLKLSHPHIVRIHDFLQDDEGAAVMMEFVDGWSLWSLKVDKPRHIFSHAEISPWLLQLCDALDYAHNHAGIVHRDLNPTNLMLSSRGQLKITDFGMARNIKQSRARDFVDARVAGTDLYMSPQQWAGEAPAVTDDIYSIGATIFELLTGKPPFYQGDILKQVFETVPPTMKERLAELGVRDVEIPDAFEETVAACLAKDPSHRPANVNELPHRLGLILGAQPPAPLTTAAPPEPEPASGPEPEPEISAPDETEFVEDAPPSAGGGENFFTGAKGIVAALAFAAFVGLAVWLVMSASAKKHLAKESSLEASAPGVFPQPGKSWQNSLGMKFVPVPGVSGLFSIWETRLQDFSAYVAELGHAPGNNMLSVDSANAWKETGHSWLNPEFDQNTNHPVVGVNWNEAVAFCDWLTTRERAAGWIATNQGYRLPTSAEFLKAAGPGRFAWGDTWPPPPGAGNFAGEEIRARLPAHPFLGGYNDGWSGTAPVGSFAPNQLGIFDLNGNVCELCGDHDPRDRARRPWLAGGSWQDSTALQLSLTNLAHIRPAVRASDCGFRVLLEIRSGSTNAPPAQDE